MADLTAQFDDYVRQLLISPAVKGFKIVRRRVQDFDGYIRIRAELIDEGLFEFSEFWLEQTDGNFARQEYTFHWQSSAGIVFKRWDNADHLPDLPNAPHHVHRADGVTEDSAELPNLYAVLKEIENKIL
jgi:hypothetical protein